MRKRGQEELVGFAVVIVLVTIVVLVILGFMATQRSPSVIESTGTAAILSASLGQITTCETNLEVLSVSQTLALCSRNERCLDETPACSIANQTFTTIFTEAIPVGADFPLQGFEFKASVKNNSVISISKGSKTGIIQTARQSIQSGTERIETVLTIYSSS
ncbi:hypothetical protein KBD68_04665 [Candidatus Woesebacteria bacterium]|nr:hypothetical protein [Candidatus Woesebacteria bacterium]